MKNYKEILYREIGDRIKEKRQELRMSQKDLAKSLKSNDLKISRASISNIEVGRHHVPLHTLYEIAQILGTDISSLLPNYAELVDIVTSRLDDFSNIIEEKNLSHVDQYGVKEIIKGLK